MHGTCIKIMCTTRLEGAGKVTMFHLFLCQCNSQPASASILGPTPSLLHVWFYGTLWNGMVCYDALKEFMIEKNGARSAIDMSCLPHFAVPPCLLG